MAVSGGPDSIALCVLTAGWKSNNFDAVTGGRSKPIDGLLAIVVDHGLRTESAEEANLVSSRVLDMGNNTYFFFWVAYMQVRLKMRTCS